MMEDTATLLAIAEIAGVFVGFAALVTVVAGRSDTASQTDDSHLIKHLGSDWQYQRHARPIGFLIFH